MQGVLLCISVLAFAFKLGPVLRWSFVGSLGFGLVAFVFGIIAAIATRRVRWLGLSAAATFVALFSLLIGVALGGGFGA